MKQIADIDKIVMPILQWYEANRRILPWREDPTPYHVWISEIMLQQTRVEAVKGYYARFMSELPDVSALARVDDEKLLKLWEGLGYYNRARNLKKAANVMIEQYDGQLPSSPEQLRQLPGIGDYTSGAIASIAFGIPVPAVDGNVLRVITRITADESDITKDATKKAIASKLLSIMPKKPGAFNQALMDIGASICLPNGAPRCETCPVKMLCEANLKHLTEQIPRKTPKKPRVIEEKTLVIIRMGEDVLLHKRPNHGLLAGMYELPSIFGFQTQENVISYVEELGVKPIFVELLPDSKHIFTHKEWRMKAYFVKADELSTQRDITKTDTHYMFVNPKMTEDAYPIPSAFSAYEHYIRVRTNELARD